MLLQQLGDHFLLVGQLFFELRDLAVLRLLHFFWKKAVPEGLNYKSLANYLLVDRLSGVFSRNNEILNSAVQILFQVWMLAY